jgi:uncharacterized protein
METVDYIFIFTAYIVASGIKGLTGVGFSTSCLPVMALHLDLKVAIPLVVIPSIVSNIALMYQAKQFGAALTRFWPLYLANVPGLFIGLGVLVVIPANMAKAILGLVLVMYALWSLRNRFVRLGSVWERRLKIPTGFLNGCINGLTGSQVMPVLPFMLSLDLDKNLFVQAINISFTLSSLVLLLGMNQLGLISPDTFLIALVGLVPILVTVHLAGKLQCFISGSQHRLLVLFILLLMGMSLMARMVF